MEVYLIRHGETGGNVAHRHQAENTPLTKHGEEQAFAIAETVSGLQPTHLLTSPLVRSIETARIIGNECDLTPETNMHFAELRRPSRMYGNYHTSVGSMWFYALWFLGYTNDRDGESYRALRERIASAKLHFKSYPEDSRVVVVSHSVFINLFLTHLCDDKAIGPFKAAKAFINIMSMKNTGLVPLVFDPEAHPNTCGWLRIED